MADHDQLNATPHEDNQDQKAQTSQVEQENQEQTQDSLDETKVLDAHEPDDARHHDLDETQNLRQAVDTLRSEDMFPEEEPLAEWGDDHVVCAEDKDEQPAAARGASDLDEPEDLEVAGEREASATTPQHLGEEASEVDIQTEAAVASDPAQAGRSADDAQASQGQPAEPADESREEDRAADGEGQLTDADLLHKHAVDATKAFSPAIDFIASDLQGNDARYRQVGVEGGVDEMEGTGRQAGTDSTFQEKTNTATKAVAVPLIHKTIPSRGAAAGQGGGASGIYTHEQAHVRDASSRISRSTRRSEVPDNKPSSKKKLLVIALIALLVAGGAGWYVQSAKQKKAEEEKMALIREKKAEEEAAAKKKAEGEKKAAEEKKKDEEEKAKAEAQAEESSSSSSSSSKGGSSSGSSSSKGGSSNGSFRSSGSQKGGSSSGKGGSSSPSSTSSSSSSQSASKNAAIYNRIYNMWVRAGELDKQVSNAAYTFNHHAFSGSLSSRRAYRSQAHAVQARVQALINEAYSTSTSGTPYYSDLQNMKRLAVDLRHRISVINQCWDISCRYSDASAHVEAIRQPIYRVQGKGGTNPYYLDFKRLYGRAKPYRK